MSLNLLLRSPSVFSNVTLDSMRKRQGLSFRKTLGVYNYKIKKVGYYNNPHAIELKKVEQLKQDGSEKSMRKIKALERISNRPFGHITTRGRFIRDTRKIPNYNIPDLTDFELKPYVSYHTEPIMQEFKYKPIKMSKNVLMAIGKEQLSVSKDPLVKNLYNEIFNTEEGKKIVEEYLEKLNRKAKLRVTNNF